MLNFMALKAVSNHFAYIANARNSGMDWREIQAELKLACTVEDLKLYYKMISLGRELNSR